MKNLSFIILFFITTINQVFAFKLISERSWTTGSAKGYVEVINNDPKSKFFGAGVYIRDQFGYQGIEVDINSTHTFYLYHPFTKSNILKANICDSYNNCFHHERHVLVDPLDGIYSERVVLHLLTSSDKVGKFTIFADTQMISSNNIYEKKEANLLISPFPYD